MIYFFTAWDDNGNLGQAYNRCMDILPSDDDYGCFLDGDAVYTTSDFGLKLGKIIQANKGFDLFTCMTNRVGQKYQLVEGTFSNDSMAFHRAKADYLWKKNGTKVVDITNHLEFSGVLMVLSKATWKKMDGFRETGILGVDTDVHNRIRHISGKVGLMTGFYVQHWYRGGKQLVTKK